MNRKSKVKSLEGGAGKLTKPLFHKTEYDFSAGTELLITLKNGNIFEGKAMTNPMATREHGTIDLLDVKNRKTGRILADPILIHDYEIESVQILKRIRSSQRNFPEFNLPTILIDSEEKLVTFLKTISETEVQEMGVALHGVGSGRFGQVAWILLSTEKSIVPIDVVELESNKVDIWKLLKHPIFQNKSILKVFHNLRPAADYLFHRHQIDVKNVYDTQLMDYILSRKSQQSRKEQTEGPTKMIPLYAALKKYLAQLAPDAEIVWLKWYFKYPKFNSTTSNPLLVRPAPHHNFTKYMALSVKYLLPLKKEIEWIKNKNFRELFKTYKRVTIEADVNSVDEEEMLAELPQIIDHCFAGAGGQGSAAAGAQLSGGGPS